MWMILVAIIAGLIVSRLFKWAMRRNLRKPPRVPGLPFIGNIFQVKAPALHQGLSDCAKRYGDIYTINLMGLELVILNSTEVIREACVEKGHDFADRLSTTYMYKAITYDGNDIVLGPYNRALSLFRKTVHASFMSCGEESTKIQEVIQNELEVLVENYERTAGQFVDPQPDLRTAIANVIACLLIGRDIEKDSTEERNLNNMVTSFTVLGAAGYGAELDLFPFLRLLPVASMRCLRRFLTARDSVLGPMYEDAKATFDPQCMRGFVDMLINARQCHLEPDGTPIIKEKNILAAMTVMFTAGVFTTFSTLSSLMLICLHRPDVQEKLQEEIDRVIGQHQRPAVQHGQKMHFLNATLLEVLRYVGVAAITPRSTARDTTIRGYDIEKGTIVLINFWEAHHNTEWKDPWQFRPERFLDENGELLQPDHPTRVRLIPFGAGARSCVGERFARNRIFLFIATLWQRFSFLPIPGQNLPSCDPRDFITTTVVVPGSFRCIIMKRH